MQFQEFRCVKTEAVLWPEMDTGIINPISKLILDEICYLSIGNTQLAQATDSLINADKSVDRISPMGSLIQLWNYHLRIHLGTCRLHFTSIPLDITINVGCDFRNIIYIL